MTEPVPPHGIQSAHFTGRKTHVGNGHVQPLNLRLRSDLAAVASPIAACATDTPARSPISLGLGVPPRHGTQVSRRIFCGQLQLGQSGPNLPDLGFLALARAMACWARSMAAATAAFCAANSVLSCRAIRSPALTRSPSEPATQRCGRHGRNLDALTSRRPLAKPALRACLVYAIGSTTARLRRTRGPASQGPCKFFGVSGVMQQLRLNGPANRLQQSCHVSG